MNPSRRPGEPCEGGCGCRLNVRPGIRPQEILEDAPGFASGPSTLGDIHSAERCQIIRILREAGETAAGPGGYAVVAVRPVGPVVCAFDGTGRWAQKNIAWALLLRVGSATLRGIAAHTAEQLRRALQSTVTTGGHAEEMPVLARNPRHRPSDPEETQ